jgi:hypothetical protein
MSEATNSLQKSIEQSLDYLTMSAFNDGYETATHGLDELSNIKHNENDKLAAEVLRWAAKELRGENVSTN